MNDPKQEITPEQQKQIKKLLFKARVGLLGVTSKFMVGIFAANMITIFIGNKILTDSDPDMLVGYQGLTVFLNLFFMIRYLDRQLKAHYDRLSMKVKEILEQDNSQQ